MNNKILGEKNEEQAKHYYQQQWRKLLAQNFTIRGGEIDLLMKKEQTIVVIEVKTINHIDELDQYISSKKIWFLQRTLEHYLQTIKSQEYEEVRMDAVFIKQGKIIEIYEDITNK